MFEAYYRSSRDAKHPHTGMRLCAFNIMRVRGEGRLMALAITNLVFFASRTQLQTEEDEVIDDDGVVRLCI